MNGFNDRGFDDRSRLPRRWRNPFLHNLELRRMRASVDIYVITRPDFDVWMWRMDFEVPERLREASDSLGI